MSGELIVSIAGRVLGPLLAGGELRPLPPIGEARALAALEYAAVAGDALGEARPRRLRVARTITAVDAMGDPTPAEWLMLFSLNDLLQSTNLTLSGVFGAKRAAELLEMVTRVVARAGAPATVGEALSRHATFSRLLEIVRVDTHVSWWVGSQSFRGMKPPKRLLAWPRVRRVHESEETVPLTEMTPATDSALPLFSEALGLLLAASPLTDLATAGRATPAFRWTGASLALIATPAGKTLALRVLERARGRNAAYRAVKDVPTSLLRAGTPEAARASAAVSELVLDFEKRCRLEQAGTTAN